MIYALLLSASIARGATSLPEALEQCQNSVGVTMVLERDLIAIANAGIARNHAAWLDHIDAGELSAEDSRMGLAISVINLATARCAAAVLEQAFGASTTLGGIGRAASTRRLADQLALFAGVLNQPLKFQDGPGFAREMRRLGLAHWLDTVIQRLGDPSQAKATIRDAGEQIVFEATARVLSFQAALQLH